MFVRVAFLNDDIPLLYFQGKSRSTTAVVAYIMALRDASFSETIALVKEKRKMADPNPHFVYRLAEFEKSNVKSQLHLELTS